MHHCIRLNMAAPSTIPHQLRLLELKRLMIIQYAAGPKSSTRMFHQKWLQHLSTHIPSAHHGDGCKKWRNSPAFVLTITTAISHNFSLATNDTNSTWRLLKIILLEKSSRSLQWGCHNNNLSYLQPYFLRITTPPQYHNTHIKKKGFWRLHTYNLKGPCFCTTHSSPVQFVVLCHKINPCGVPTSF